MSLLLIKVHGRSKLVVRMNPHMFRSCQNYKILRPIVFWIMIDMVNNLILCKFSSEYILHDKNMLVGEPTIFTYNYIRISHVQKKIIP